MTASKFLKILTISTIVSALIVGLAYGVMLKLTSGLAAAMQPAQHASDPKLTAEQSPSLPSAEKVAAKTSEEGVAVKFVLKAAVTSEDGPTASIEAFPQEGPCTEPSFLGGRVSKSTGFEKEISLSKEVTWCLKIKPRQPVVAHSLPGVWTRAGTEEAFEADAENQYLPLVHQSGKALALRAVAAGYCPSENSRCAGTVVLELSIDDKNLMLPLQTSSKEDTVIQLTAEQN